MLLTTLAFLVAAAPKEGWEFKGPYTNLAAIVDKAVVDGRGLGHEVILWETIPNTKAELNFKTSDFSTLMYRLASQTPIRLLAKDRSSKEYPKAKTWYVMWSEKPVPKGKVRLYFSGGSHRLEVDEAPVSAITEAMRTIGGYDPEDEFNRNGLMPNTVVKGFRSTPRPGSGETMEDFAGRFVREYLKAQDKPKPPPTKRAVWNLTFLPGEPPGPHTGEAKINFSRVGATAAALAEALNTAFGPKGDGEEKEPPKREVTVHAVKDSLVIDGKPELVDHIRRLLATQLDVPQSQIMLELDAYQVSANPKAREGATRSVQRLILGQEIARAYKQAHLQAVRGAIYQLNDDILEAMKARVAEVGLDVPEMLQRLGLDPEARRAIGQSEMLLFLSYCPSEGLESKYREGITERFEETRQSVKSLLIDPLSQSPFKPDRLLAMELTKLNDKLGKFDWNADGKSDRTIAALPPGTPADKFRKDPRWWASSLVRHFAQAEKGRGSLENTITRAAIEEFLVLWLMNADPASLKVVTKLASDPAPGGQEAPEEREKTLQRAYAQGLAQLPYVRPNAIVQSPVVTGGDKKPTKEELEARLGRFAMGDRTAKLVRASTRLDDLMQVGLESIYEDSRSLVDAPLQSWIDQQVLSRHQKSTFGVRYGGTTRLRVTSRTPGVTGSEAESFYPFQPVAPIGLESLVPILSRKTPPATNPTPPTAAGGSGGNGAGGNGAGGGEPETPAKPSIGDMLALGGVTPLETILLEGIFAQAAVQPYHRKLATGIHFSVLPTMLSNGSTARLQVRLSLSVNPSETDNTGGQGDPDKPAPVDLLKSTVVETELLANAFDITQVSSLKLDIAAPGKRDWEIPILSQILPIRSWFVGPTRDKTVRHEAVVLVKVAIVPKAMDLASRYLNSE